MSYEKTSVDVEGLSELLIKLRAMPEKLATKVQREAMKDACTLVRNAAAKLPNIGEKTGNLKRGFTIKISRRKNQIVGQIVNVAPHAHLVEFGHKMVSHRGRLIKAKVGRKPFMRPALKESAKQVLELMKRDIQAGIQRFKE